MSAYPTLHDLKDATDAAIIDNNVNAITPAIDRGIRNDTIDTFGTLFAARNDIAFSWLASGNSSAPATYFALNDTTPANATFITLADTDAGGVNRSIYLSTLSTGLLRISINDTVFVYGYSGGIDLGSQWRFQLVFKYAVGSLTVSAPTLLNFADQGAVNSFYLVEVSGAGTAGVNGIYEYAGSYNGRPWYALVGGTNTGDPLTSDAIYPTGPGPSDVWGVFDAYGSALYLSDDDVTTAPYPWMSSDWGSEGGDNPAPTVTQGEQSIQEEFDDVNARIPAPGPLTYSALITQAATDPPAETDIHQNIGQVLSWVRNGPGNYTATFSPVLTGSTYATLAAPIQFDGDISYCAIFADNNGVSIVTIDGALTQLDGLLAKNLGQAIIITNYP